MAKVIFLAGLPGSGKSRYMKQLSDEMGMEKFDDFKANAIADCHHFPFARRYVELINALRAGKDCIVSDIDFCKSTAQEEAEQCVTELIPAVEVEWIFFKNDFERCCQNIKRRTKMEGRDFSGPMDALHKYSPIYDIPTGAKIIPVWSGVKEQQDVL